MIKTKDQIEKIVKEIHQNIDFSGVVLIKKMMILSMKIHLDMLTEVNV